MESLPTDRPGSGASTPRFWQWGGWGLAGSWRDVRFRDVAVVIVVASTIWGRLDVVKRGEIRGDRVEIHKTDLTVFTEAGAAFFDGRDPYKVTNPRGWFYLYPPLFALLLAPLSPLDSQAQVGVWFAISVGLGFAAFFEARRLWRALASEMDRGLGGWIAACGLIAAALPTLDCLQRGQVGVALLYPLLLGARLILEARSWPRIFLGGVALALPVVIKLIPLLPVGALLGLLWVASITRNARREPRAAAATSGIFAGFLLFLVLIPGSLIGWQKNADSLTTWARGVAGNRQVDKAHGFDIYSVRNQSLANGAHLLTRKIQGPVYDKAARRRRDEVIDRCTLVARAAILVALTVTGLALGRRGDRLGLAAAFGLACSAMLLVSPLSWGHYFLLMVPAILFVPLWLARRGRRRSARVFSAVPAALILAQYIAMSSAGEAGLLGLGSTAWFLAACVATFRAIGDDRASGEIHSADASRRSRVGASTRGRPTLVA